MSHAPKVAVVGATGYAGYELARLRIDAALGEVLPAVAAP